MKFSLFTEVMLYYIKILILKTLFQISVLIFVALCTSMCRGRVISKRSYLDHSVQGYLTEVNFEKISINEMCDFNGSAPF